MLLKPTEQPQDDRWFWLTLAALAAIYAASLLLAGCATRAAINGIPNFGTVEPGIYRGGQPEAWAWGYLRALGVSNVVKLNLESEGSDTGAKACGMRVAYVPISTSQQLLGPMQYQVWIASTNICPGTFIHCTHGRNRTGTVIGAWRVWHCGWTKAQARAEMGRYGWGDSLPGLKWFWREKVRCYERR